MTGRAGAAERRRCLPLAARRAGLAVAARRRHLPMPTRPAALALRSLLAAVLATTFIGVAGATDAATPAPVVSHGPRDRPVVALTIDDGEDPAVCSQLVDILVRRRIPATFFPAAKWAELDPALWHRIAAIGFPIGDHTATHRLLGGLSLEAQTAEIADGARRIERASGTRPIPVLRPPGGSWDPTTRVAATRAGDRMILLWDTTFADTSRNDKHPADYIRRGIAGQNGSVVLLHCWPTMTLRVLEPIVDDYLARGFRFVTVPELFGFPGPTPDFDAPAAMSPSPSAPASAPSSASADPSFAVSSPTAAASSPSADSPVGSVDGGTPRSPGDASALALAVAVLVVVAAAAGLLLAILRRRGRSGPT